jgi:hypothetical protein
MDRAPAPSPAPPRTRGAAARALVIWGVASASACALNQQGVTPPADTFFYPASAVVDPSGSWLFVTNSNADLRFNDGTLVMVDLQQAHEDRLQGGGPVLDSGGPVTAAGGPSQSWSPCPQEDYVNPLPRSDPQICCWDRLDPNILNCDERRYVQADFTVRIGSFAAGMIWQPYCPDVCNTPTPATTTMAASPGCSTDNTAGRLFIGVRGDTSLTWIDVAKLPSAPTFTFDCGQTGGRLAECSVSHRLTEARSALSTESTDPAAPMVNLPDEPYALALQSSRGLLYAGHLVGNTSTTDSGGVSVFDVSGTGDGSATPRAPSFIAPFPSVFPPNSAGFYGITALKLHVPLGQPQPQPVSVSGQATHDESNDEIFATSRYLPLVTSIVPFVPSGSNASCPPNSNSDLVVEGAADSFNSGLVGSEMRGVEIIDPGDPTVAAQRAYALQRVPPALVGFTIAPDNAGAVITTPTDVSETCSSPTFLYQHDAGEGPRLYVNCFDTGEIYVFDPSVPTLLTSFQVGRGPAGLVFPDAYPQRAYLIGFSDNNVSVLDLAPKSPTQYHVIQRLGFPSVTPR